MDTNRERMSEASSDLINPQDSTCLRTWTQHHQHLLWRVLKDRPLTVKVDDKTARELGNAEKGKWITISGLGITRTNSEVLLTKEAIQDLVRTIPVRPNRERLPVEKSVNADAA